MTTSPLGPGPLVYAHRGDRSRAKDNTIEAYQLAVQAGANGIELDVRRTRDGVLIISHDDRHEDLEPFSSLDFADLRSLAPTVPTFKESMEAIPHDVFVNVEIKNFPHEDGFDADRNIVDETLNELRTYDNPGRILLSSFDPVSMQRAGEVGPEFLRGQLVLVDVPLETGMALALESQMDAVIPNYSHMKDNTTLVMRTIKSAGLRVVVWGVNTSEEIIRMVNADADVIITDDPGMALEVMDQL